MRLIVLTAFLTITATAAIAAEPTTPKKVVKDIVENAKRAPDGTMQPSTGRARPVENWFGCKPGQKKGTKCQSQTSDEGQTKK